MYALMQKFTLIVSLSQSDSNLKSKREHQIAIENTYCWTDTSSYRFDELFLRIVKIEHRIDQDVSSINSLIKKKLVEAQMTAILKHPGSSRFGKQDTGYLRRCLQVIFSKFSFLKFAKKTQDI